MTQPQRLQQPPQGVLPVEARNRLIAAARIQDERARRIAVDAAIDAVKLRYPNFFYPQPFIKE